MIPTGAAAQSTPIVAYWNPVCTVEGKKGRSTTRSIAAAGSAASTAAGAELLRRRIWRRAAMTATHASAARVAFCGKRR